MMAPPAAMAPPPAAMMAPPPSKIQHIVNSSDDEDTVTPAYTAPRTPASPSYGFSSGMGGATAAALAFEKPPEKEVPPRTGKNAQGNSEWLLPDPPVGEEHRYVFQLFATDLPLTLMPGATHDDLVRNLDGHVTAAAVLTARFEGHEVEELDVEDLGDVD